jgi:ribonuclease D
MRPRAVYDTELAGRLAGYDRVNLAAMVSRLLGLGLAKGHGAADWSKRPLPPTLLNYAALDVEVLLDLHTAVAHVLADQGKTEWAAQEFEYVRTADTASLRRDRWRRTSGIHKVRDPRGLAAVREMWTVRDEIARRRDIAPGRILPDASIIVAAMADPKTVEDLTALPIFGGPRQRRSADTWLAALARARDNPEPPSFPEPPNGPPPVSRWHRRKPEAAARLKAARDGLADLSERVGVPTENLVPPELVRRLCWDWRERDDDERSREEQKAAVAGDIDAFLRDGGARPWQRVLTAPVLAAALTPTAST